jgi:WD40 repeat protein
MLYKIVVLVFLLLACVTPVLMQDHGQSVSGQQLDPGALFYQEDSLYNVTAKGLKHVLDVPGITELLGTNYPAGMRLSPDGSTLLFSTVGYGGDLKKTLYLYDLTASECCVTLPAPAKTSLSRIVFSPDGTQFAASYLDIPPNETLNQITIFDTATGQTIKQLDAATLNNGTAPYGDLLAWVSTGMIIQVRSSLEAAPAAIVWNPETNTINEASSFYGLFSAQGFLVTGESIISAFDPAFPSADESSNVILYANANTDPSAAAMPIYTNAEALSVTSAFWVADGQAALVHFYDQTDTLVSTVLLRDGTIIPTDMPEEEYFAGSTRDGWLTTEPMTGIYTYYRLDGTSIEVLPLGEIVDAETLMTGGFEPVWVPVGASLTETVPFPTVTAP